MDNSNNSLAATLFAIGVSALRPDEMAEALAQAEQPHMTEADIDALAASLGES